MDDSLRARAAALLAERSEPAASERLSAHELRQAVHELHIHQIELELQNDELQAAQRRLEDSRAALAESERRYRDLFERAPVGYVRVDRTGPILEANQAIEALLGAEPGGLTGRKLYEFVTPAFTDAYFLHRQAALRGESPDPVRVVLRALDGELRNVEVTARASGDPVASLRISVVDTSASERPEVEHRASEQQRGLLASALPIAVAYVGADGRFEFCNRAFEALCGSQRATIEGRFLLEILGATAYVGLREHVRAALGGESARFEGTLSFPAAASRFASVLLAPDWLPAAGVRGFWMLIEDNTELEAARRGLRRAAAQIALAEERERRALAADLHDDVGQLMSLASFKLHELQAHASEPRAATLLAEVEELTRRAQKSVSSLTFELSPPLLYDVGFIATAEWLAENLRDRYGLRTTIEKRGDEPELDEATRVTLYRALRELLINVAKHAGTNEAQVVIDAGPAGVAITVQDHGFGFDPQAPADGFGLRSIRERIESLGGRIVLDSTRGEGVRVVLTVPLAPGAR